MTVAGVLYLTLFASSLAQGQFLMEGSRPGGPTRLLPSDAAILEGREPRADLPCDVKPTKPVLGYDLTFHAGYEIGLPLQALVGEGNSLTALLRVTPEGGEGSVYFWQKWTVPPLEQTAKGDMYLHGALALGEGRYEVAWLLRDRDERICSAFWDVSTLRRGRDRQIKLDIAPGVVEPPRRELFRDEGPVRRDAEHPLNVLVLLHVGPQALGSAEMQRSESQAMVSILRNIMREQRFTKFSVTAFNIDQRTVIFRQENAPKIDFPALGQAVSDLHFGTVTIQRLSDKDGGPRFLAGLFAEELATQHPDVLMIVGPKRTREQGSLRDSLKRLPNPGCPVFYLNYNADPEANLWRDQLGAVVEFWKGVEYSISKPSDLFFAWSGVVSRLKGNSAERTSALSGPVDGAPLKIK
jgi:hypothetical protein